MELFLIAIAIVPIMTTVMTAIGWAVGVLTGNRWLQGTRLESWIAQFLTGTGICILLAGSLSFAGMPARDARLPLALIVASLVGAALAIRRPVIHWRRVTARASMVYLVGACFAAWFTLSLFLHTECAGTTWDTITYVTISRWLQDNGFGLGAIEFDRAQPGTKDVWVYQAWQLRMGSTFLLAMLQAYFGLDAMQVHPIVMCWGMLLNLGALFLLARWTFRLNRLPSAAAILAASVGINPLYTSIYQGFQPQMFGTAYFAFVMAILSRSVRPSFWTPANAFALSLATATFLSVYSDIAPLLAMVALGFWAMTVWNARRLRLIKPFLRFSLWTVGALALLGNVEWLRAVHAIRLQSGAVVGGHIAWEPKTFAAFALGATPNSFDNQVTPSRLPYTAILGLLFLIGLWRTFRDGRAAMAAIGLAVFAGMIVYFTFWAVNPFTGAIGHTWSVYKLTKWEYPLVLTTQFAGLAWLTRRWRLPKLTLLIPGIVALFASASHHAVYCRTEGLSIVEHTGTRKPVPEWKRLGERLDQLGVERVILLHAGAAQCRSYNLGSYVFYPRRVIFAIDRFDSSWGKPNNPAEPLQPGTAVIMWGPLPFGGPTVEQLPGNITLLDSARPCIVEVGQWNWLVQTDANGRSSIEVGPEGVALKVWAPRSGTVRFSSESRTTAGVSLQAECENTPGTKQRVPAAENLHVDLLLQPDSMSSGCNAWTRSDRVGERAKAVDAESSG